VWTEENRKPVRAGRTTGRGGGAREKLGSRRENRVKKGRGEGGSGCRKKKGCQGKRVGASMGGVLSWSQGGARRKPSSREGRLGGRDVLEGGSPKNIQSKDGLDQGIFGKGEFSSRTPRQIISAGGGGKPHPFEKQTGGGHMGNLSNKSQTVFHPRRGDQPISGGTEGRHGCRNSK